MSIILANGALKKENELDTQIVFEDFWASHVRRVTRRSSGFAKIRGSAEPTLDLNTGPFPTSGPEGAFWSQGLKTFSLPVPCDLEITRSMGRSFCPVDYTFRLELPLERRNFSRVNTRLRWIRSWNFLERMECCDFVHMSESSSLSLGTKTLATGAEDGRLDVRGGCGIERRESQICGRSIFLLHMNTKYQIVKTSKRQTWARTRGMKTFLEKLNEDQWMYHSKMNSRHPQPHWQPRHRSHPKHRSSRTRGLVYQKSCAPAESMRQGIWSYTRLWRHLLLRYYL